MTEPLPESQKNIGSRAVLWGVTVAGFVVIILIIGFMPETGTFLDPAFSQFRGDFFPGMVALNTTSVDPGINISIDENTVRTGGRRTRYSYTDVIIGITNTHHYPVLVYGMCTYADASGRQISSTRIPNGSAYNIPDASYSIPAGEKINYRFILRITPPGERATSPPLAITSDQSSQKMGVLSCAILNVSQKQPVVQSIS